MAMPVENKQLGLAIMLGLTETSGPTSYLNRPKRPRHTSRTFGREHSRLSGANGNAFRPEQVITPVSLEYAPIYDLNDSRQEAARRD